jgi:flagellar protein FliL
MPQTGIGRNTRPVTTGLAGETELEVSQVKLLRLFPIVMAVLLALPTLLLAEDEEKEEAEPVVIHYYQVKPSLVANLASGGRYIRCDIQLMTHDEAFVEDMRLHDAAIRHTLLLLLSDQDGNKIKTPDGKEGLRKEAMSQINQLLKELTGKAAVESLFFTTFFVQ